MARDNVYTGDYILALSTNIHTSANRQQHIREVNLSKTPNTVIQFKSGHLSNSPVLFGMDLCHA